MSILFRKFRLEKVNHSVGFVGWRGIFAELCGIDAPSITDFFRLYCAGFDALSDGSVTDVKEFCCFIN